MEQIKNVFKQLLSLTTTPTQTWTYLDDKGTAESDVEEVQWRFYFPWLVVASACILVLNVFHAYSNDLDHEVSVAVAAGMRQMVPVLVSYFAAPYVVVAVLRELYPLALHYQIEKHRLEIFVRYAMSFVIMVEVLCAFISQLRLLSFFNLYLVFIIWAGSAIYNHVQEAHRWRFTVITSAAIYVLPILLTRILCFLIR